MSTPVVMPQMGESIAEGTIVRWIKKVGDTVDRDEPLFEISTDKVDAEVPSPAAGVLTEITVREGETVAVNSVVATIGSPGSTPSPTSTRVSTAAARSNVDTAAVSTPSPGDGQPPSTTLSDGDMAPGNGPNENEPSTTATTDALRRQKSSPLVRRIAKEHNVDITRISGSGSGGRVTKQDILGYLDSGIGDLDSGLGARDSGLEVAAPSRSSPESRAPSPESRVEIKPLSIMRRKIAEHMILSRRTSAHVHSVFHVNFSRIERIRHQKKDEYERLGGKLTYMAFIAKAVVDVLRRHPIVNASLDGENVVFKKDINLGVAVALESGLIVPVIKHADEKSLLGLSRAIADVAERARRKQLKPEEVHDGTFTITNPGQFGAQFGMPIINQPQVAILGVGAIEKRPIVVDDAIAIRTMAYLTLGYDHRLVDGAVADQFMSDVKNQLENFSLSD